MKTKICKTKGRISLVLDSQDYPKSDRPVLAQAIEDEGTGCWMIADIRLTDNPQVSVYACSIAAEDVRAQFRPDSEELAIMVKGKLREYRVTEDGTIEWCTFRNLVRGDVEVRGYTPVRSGDYQPPLYHTRTTVMAYLKQAQEFWEGYEGAITDVRIDNPNSQPRESMFSFMQFDIERLREKRLVSVSDAEDSSAFDC